MYTVMLHKILDKNGIEFLKISYSGLGILTYISSQKWKKYPHQLMWHKNVDTKVEAEAFKKTYRDLYPDKYKSEIGTTIVDSFIGDVINPETVQTDQEYVDKIIEDGGTPVFIYLLKLTDGWFKVGVTINSPKEAFPDEIITWAAKVSEGRDYAGKFRDFVHNKCSSKRTTKGSLYGLKHAWCFQPDRDVTDVKALKQAWLDSGSNIKFETESF